MGWSDRFARVTTDILAISGPLGSERSQEFDEVLSAFSNRACAKLIVDLTEVPYISTDCRGRLIAASLATGKDGKDLEIRVNPETYSSFRVSALQKLLHLVQIAPPAHNLELHETQHASIA